MNEMLGWQSQPSMQDGSWSLFARAAGQSFAAARWRANCHIVRRMCGRPDEPTSITAESRVLVRRFGRPLECRRLGICEPGKGAGPHRL